MTDTTHRGKNAKSITIALLCGGPSLERGISLNSARSVMDHLGGEQVVIKPIYFNQKKQAFLLSEAQLYSNTPADFDFKLDQRTQFLDEYQLEKQLRAVDIVFPVVHGEYGEDGALQKWLEERDIPFVGSSSAACKQAFDKYRANEFIKNEGFFTLPSCLVKIYKDAENAASITDFFKKHRIQRAIVKPASGGSSIGVFSVGSAEEAIEKAHLIFSKRMDTRVVVEPFVEGREFTVIILQSRYGLPVAILPTEIETDYSQHQVFDYRKKYLPTRQVTYHCPPRFDDRIIERIQTQSEQMFELLGMSDFARFDGWVLDDGSIWFADFNPISGMEQNSFLFQQAARIGLSHKDVLQHIINSSCDRQGIKHPLSYDTIGGVDVSGQTKKPIAVIMGGATSERQVSLMSGTNVWLKLRNSADVHPVPYVMDLEGGVWKVPYQLMLNHTVEEIVDNCRSAALHEARIGRFEVRARERLGFYGESHQGDFGEPEKLTLDEFLDSQPHVFIALHGGLGEDGRLQAMLEERGSIFNGPGSAASKLCMDKQATADAVRRLELPRIYSIEGVSYTIDQLHTMNADGVEALWQALSGKIGSRSLIAKPMSDGCSSGVVRLHDSGDLAQYMSHITRGDGAIPAQTFRDQDEAIELPLVPPNSLRFERFIQADTIRIKGGQLKHVQKTRFVEVTVGVVEKDGAMHSLSPSITVADGPVLSVEEKFQGGTGINLTPPPESVVAKSVCNKVKRSMELLATRLGVGGYCRIDAFIDCETAEVYVIEVNTLPGLTPSTVIFQQALAEKPVWHPQDFLEHISRINSVRT